MFSDKDDKPCPKFNEKATRKVGIEFLGEADCSPFSYTTYFEYMFGEGTSPLLNE